MNIRKPADYSQMYAALDNLLVADFEQMELFCEIGRVIDERPEKGAAVAAAEYINAAFPDRGGFSPRSLRRMRDFYRAYKDDPELMSEAMGVSWSLNALIIERCEEHDIRKWYVKACLYFGWSKQELRFKIDESIHENAVLDMNDIAWYTESSRDRVVEQNANRCTACSARQHLLLWNHLKWKRLLSPDLKNAVRVWYQLFRHKCVVDQFAKYEKQTCFKVDRRQVPWRTTVWERRRNRSPNLIKSWSG